MGQIISYMWPDTGRTDDPDPVTKLTSRQRYLIRTTWEKFTENQSKVVDTGVLIFLTLFQIRPEYQNLFPFRDVPMEELPKSPRFKAHCVSVVYALTSLVTNIDSPELLKELLLKQGVAHVPRGVKTEAYDVLKSSIMQIFNKALTPEELESWDKFLTLGVQIILEGAQSV